MAIKCGNINNSGKTLAHVAAEHGYLPDDLNLWDLADNEGWTAVHIVAGHRLLPNNFNLLSLADKKFWTVAYEAVNIATYHKILINENSI